MRLRPVEEEDLETFFAHQQDREALYAAAFTPPDPADREAFDAHWGRIRRDPSVSINAVIDTGTLAGHVASYESDLGREVTYWLGRDHWGRGVATEALGLFLAGEDGPVHARVAADNGASCRVLEKCGFDRIGESVHFAHARGDEIPEYVYRRLPER